MQPLYTTEEFQSSKSRLLLPLKCLHCEKTFYKTKHYIQQNILTSRKRATGDFCSIRCKRMYQHPPVLLPCSNCQKPTRTIPSKKSKSGHQFCCKSCSAKWNNAHKTKGTRISKLEKWLQEQLPSLYSHLEFHFNKTDTINGELDIYIPSLKLAFELNGIFHYEPIYGPEKLVKIQNNDLRKSQACHERSIELCLIDVSSQKYFKEQSAIKFLTIIQNIINLKLSGSSPVFPTA